MSNDLATFLLARIGEDEEAALAATAGSWEVRPYWFTSNGRSWASVRDVINEDIDAKDADHIARWDPARVLAECAAKRAIVESVDVLTGGDKTYTERMRHSDVEDAQYVIARDILRHLALPYADHPSFDPTWRPEQTP